MKRCICVLLAVVFLLSGCGVAKNPDATKPIDQPQEKDLVGTWETKINISELLLSGLEGFEDLGLNLLVDNISIPMQATFRDDGTYTVSIGKGDVKEHIPGILEAAQQKVTEIVESMMYMWEDEEFLDEPLTEDIIIGDGELIVDTPEETATQNTQQTESTQPTQPPQTTVASTAPLTVDDILQMGGTSMEEIREQITAQLSSDELFSKIKEELTMEGKYRLEDGKLYMTDGLETEFDTTIYSNITVTPTTLTLHGGLPQRDALQMYIELPLVFEEAN
jgi:hypothetical protein